MMTKLIFHSLVINALVVFAINADPTPPNAMDIKMPGIRPPRVDYYACTAEPVTDEAYIVKYEALAEAATAHHILLYGCDRPASTEDYWQGAQACAGSSKILFAWAKNANPTELPEDVGFHIGGDSGVNYLVLNVHYARTLNDDEPDDHSGLRVTLQTETPKYQQGIYLLMNGVATIPPKTAVFAVDVSCRYEGDKDLYAFAYRTHAHDLSRVISGYKKLEPEGWELFGKGNPQWPQMFYKMDRIHVIKPNDILVGRCVYDSSGSNHSVTMGADHTDEMCNFYIMYYTVGDAEFIGCVNDQFPADSAELPPDSLIPLPPNATLDADAHGHHHAEVVTPSTGSHVAPSAVVPTHSATTEKSMQVHDEGNAISYVTEAEGWFSPPTDAVLGQVSGVDVDSNGSVIIFHRANRVWDWHAMTSDNKMAPGLGPIDKTTLWRVDPSGHVIEQWGADMFYMPHGITIDHESNVWLTDVGMHQVFKFTKGEKKTPALTLGQLLTPGDRESPNIQFCKPTDVAVLRDGTFFVSDGYCNARILLFGARGNVINHFGSPSSFLGSLKRPNPPPQTFDTPHSLAVSEELGLLCIADRNNKRVQCFSTDGEYLFLHDHGESVFAIAFRGTSDKMLLMDANQATSSGHGNLMHVKDKDLHVVTPFSPASSDFGVVHDVAVTIDGQYAYVVTIGPQYKVHKFTITMDDGADERPGAGSEKAGADSEGADAGSEGAGADSEGAGADSEGAGADGGRPGAGSERAGASGIQPHLAHHSDSEGSGDMEASSSSKTPSQRVPVLVAIMLAVPVVCVIVILLICKVKQNNRSHGAAGKFDMGTIFSSRDNAGFAPLTSQEDHYSESEDDVYHSEKQTILDK